MRETSTIHEKIISYLEILQSAAQLPVHPFVLLPNRNRWGKNHFLP